MDTRTPPQPARSRSWFASTVQHVVTQAGCPVRALWVWQEMQANGHFCSKGRVQVTLGRLRKRGKLLGDADGLYWASGNQANP